MVNRFLFLPQILQQQLDAVLDHELKVCLKDDAWDKDADIVPFPVRPKEPSEHIQHPKAA
jgi:hypothetical protein